MPWYQESIIYHMYSLGFCGCPEINPIAIPNHSEAQIKPVHRLAKIRDYYPHFKQMGINTIYLGPIFESCTHGYDVIDYFNIDRRLGNNELLKEIINELHAQNIKVIIDGCFHHVSRLFPPFVDLRNNKQDSPYLDWFLDINYSQNTIWNDGFTYKCYENLTELPIINFNHREVKNYFHRVAKYWLKEFNIDGWRLDVAYKFKPTQWQAFCQHCYSIKPDCFIYGELIEHNYSDYINQNTFRSATNYQFYQNAWQSISQKNYFQITESIDFQKKNYPNLNLITFTGSHDTNRLHTQMYHQELISQYLTLLFTMPGIPTIYYGDEINLVGIADNLNINIRQPMPHQNSLFTEQNKTVELITKLISIRKKINPHLDQLKITQTNQKYLIYHYTNRPNIYIIINSFTYPSNLTFNQTNLSGNFTNLIDQTNIKLSNSQPLQINPNHPVILKKL